MTATTSENRRFPIDLSFLRGNIAIITVSNAAKVFGGGIIGVYVPLYFVKLGGSPVFVGIMTSVASVIQCIVLFLGGFIADYHGRRSIIVLTAFYGAFFPLLYAMMPDWRLFAILARATSVYSDKAKQIIKQVSINNLLTETDVSVRFLDGPSYILCLFALSKE